jgi:hypothetical protein
MNLRVLLDCKGVQSERPTGKSHKRQEIRIKIWLSLCENSFTKIYYNKAFWKESMVPSYPPVIQFSMVMLAGSVN